MKATIRFISMFMILLNMLPAGNGRSYRSDWSLSWEEFSAKEGKKIGLALGGGAVLGAAHIGVLKAIEEFGITVDYIAGTSIGAFVSAFYANGKHWDEIESYTEDLDWLDLSGISFSHLGLLSNKKMGKLITEKIGDIDLEDSEIPVAMITADIASGEKVVLKKGNIARAVMASTCIPGVFAPVEIDGRLLVDGGMVESVPISPLKEMGADFIIAVDLNSESSSTPENLVEVLLRSFHIMSETATKFQLMDADIIIAPDLSEFNVVDIDQSPALLKKDTLKQ
ncbi:MAG: patatin-like phospholipase family protein [Candidatus Marinimicrobia bacterium]|nr:patatin-like phospholipase family protein [Candidatus Neomarinimicrobiota bacterium]